MPLLIRTFVVVVCLGFGALAGAQPLNAAVEGLIANQQLGSSRIGVYAIDLRTGEELASFLADTPMIPASNMKLLTSGAFVSVLGADYVFRTEVWRSGDDVVIVGDGDPALADPELLAEMGISVKEFLDLWADRIVASAGGGDDWEGAD